MKLAELPELNKFLQHSMAATIAVPIENDELHASSLIYWNSTEPLLFYFITSGDSVKFTLLKSKAEINCAAVVGTTKGTPFTLQMRGLLSEIAAEENKDVLENYYYKRGNDKDDITDPNTCLLRFQPKWARFTDYSQGYLQNFLKLD